MTSGRVPVTRRHRDWRIGLRLGLQARTKPAGTFQDPIVHSCPGPGPAQSRRRVSSCTRPSLRVSPTNSPSLSPTNSTVTRTQAPCSRPNSPLLPLPQWPAQSLARRRVSGCTRPSLSPTNSPSPSLESKQLERRSHRSSVGATNLNSTGKSKSLALQ